MAKIIPAGLALILCGCGSDPAVTIAPVAASAVLEERALADIVEDAEIRLRLGLALLAESEELFGDVSTDAIEGRVLLTGSVPRAEDRVTAERLAWDIPAVRAVENRITVGPDGDLASLAQDLRITAEVRGRFLTDARIRSLNFNIETIAGVVHLMGLARDVGELRAAAEQAASVSGVRRVVSHVLLVTDPRRKAARPQSA